LNAVELALEKHRLRLEAASQRLELSRHAVGLLPVFDAAERVRTGARWAGRHPEIVAGGVALLAAVRPGTRRFLWRWGKRAFVAWQLWREGGFWLFKPLARSSDGLNSQ
jgi:hypothetical protein